MAECLRICLVAGVLLAVVNVSAPAAHAVPLRAETCITWIELGLGSAPFLSLDRRDAHYEYARKIHQWFSELDADLPAEIARRVAEAQSSNAGPAERGALWTYLTTDQPFGSFSERLIRGLRRKFRR